MIMEIFGLVSLVVEGGGGGVDVDISSGIVCQLILVIGIRHNIY